MGPVRQISHPDGKSAIFDGLVCFCCILEINLELVTDKELEPPNSPQLNALDYRVCGAMLEKSGELRSELTELDNIAAVRSDFIHSHIPDENGILARHS